MERLTDVDAVARELRLVGILDAARAVLPAADGDDDDVVHDDDTNRAFGRRPGNSVSSAVPGRSHKAASGCKLVVEPSV